MNRIILVGMSGTGKSYFGRKISEILNFAFFDTDDMICDSTNMKIEDIFAVHGEAYFRDIESEQYNSLRALQNVVISTGGGIVDREENRLLLKSEKIVIYLNSSVDYLVNNIASDSVVRPKLDYNSLYDSINSLLERRDALYQDVSSHIIDVDKTEEKEIIKCVLEISEFDK